MINIKKNWLRTWIEVDKKAIYHNISEFRKLIKPQVKLMAVIKLLKQFKFSPEGLYTHFAAAKDRLYPSYSFKQIEDFKKADELLSAKGGSAFGGKKYLRHASASAGAMLYPESHFDMVRIGIGLYGMYPNKESGIPTDIT